MQVIDIHNHFFPRSWPDLAARYGTPNWPWIKHTEPGKADIMVGDRFFRHIYSACWEPEVRLREMDRDGIDLQIISATPVLFAYERPVKDALDCAQLFNDAALELCSRGQGRMKSFCQVPLQDIDASCRELSRSMQATTSEARIWTMLELRRSCTIARMRARRCWCILGICLGRSGCRNT